MPEPIDAYHKWLGIPPSDQPPHAYRLLGLKLFESDLGVIRTAADRQMTHLRTFQLGEYSDLSQRLLNEVAAARAQLTDPKQKAEYDRRLSRRLEAVKPVIPASPPEAETTDWLDAVDLPPARTSLPPRRRPPKRSWPMIVGASATVLILVVAVIGWWVLGRGDDGLELASSTDSAAFDAMLGEAADLARAGQSQQAIATLERYMETARGADWERGRVALAEMTWAVSTSRALELWSRYKGSELADFREKGRLPESCWLEHWGDPIREPAIQKVWLATLDRALPEAAARSESKPEPTVVMTRMINVEDWPNPTTPTAAEEVESNSEAWQGKLVFFDDARLQSQVVTDPSYGHLLEVTSAAGTTYPARPRGDKLLFATHADVARQLKQLLAGKDHVQAGLYCRIEKGKKMTMSGLETFPKAIVYKLELYLPR